MIDIRQNRGFALVFSLIFLFLIVSFMAVYILAVASGVSQANRTANLKKAYYVADAGLADAYESITQAGRNFVTPPAGTPYIPSAADNGVYAVGNSVGHYTVMVTVSSVPELNYTIISTGTFGNATKTLQLKMTWASFSKYAYWSQTEINPTYGVLWWVGAPGLEMLTNGPVQTNGQLNIFGNPVFNGPVTEANLPILSGNLLGSTPTSTTPNYYYGAGTSGLESDANVIFTDGITNDAPAVTLPAQNTLNVLSAAANDGEGLVLTGTSQVIFNPTGTITVTGTVTNATGAVTATYNNTTMNPPANGVIYVQSTSGQQDGNVTVRGTVNGRLTVAADQNIYISGNVAYNSDPRTNPNSTDMLGLVANQNITILQAQTIQNDNGNPQLEMSGVLVALQGSFQVDQWWVNMGNSTAAVMDQFGSLINYVCGPTGEMDMSGNLLGGWNQIQSYDSRLATLAPPGFPPMINSSGGAVYSKLSITEL